MNTEDFLSEAMNTDCVYDEALDNRLVPRARILHAAMGLATESAEFLDALKKHIFYGKHIDTVNLKEELGDILWYVALASDELGVDIGTLMSVNIRKLQARYPDKFSRGAAITRDLDKEQQILNLGLGGGV